MFSVELRAQLMCEGGQGEWANRAMGMRAWEKEGREENQRREKVERGEGR